MSETSMNTTNSSAGDGNVELRHSPREIFGSFFLSGTEFAISVKHVQEVVNPPENYSSLPLSPDYLLGLFNLRGAIIPVVDICNLLKLKPSENKSDRKVAILELQGHCIGLLFDRTGEVFREQLEERSDFKDGSHASIVAGVFKKDDGKRIVQILNVESLFNLKSLPKAGEQIHRRRTSTNRKGTRKQSISFLVGDARCALGIAQIHEILKFDGVSESALAQGNCIGAIDLRGTTVPVIDFAALLKYRSVGSKEELLNAERRVVVLRLGDELFGLLVDAVESIVTYYDEDLRTFPTLNTERTKMFSGCISIEGKSDTLLLDVENILSDSEVAEITHGHSQIYKSKQRSESQKKQEKSARRTFITFKIGNSYAIPIGDVKEIIELPDTLLKPPGLPDECKGVLNLRGEMVLIADGRKLYREDANEKAGTEKVMVFKSNSSHFGVIVDSVEAICTFSDQDKIPLPQSLYKSDSSIEQDIGEAVMFKEPNGKETSLLIIRVESIGQRILELKAA